MTLDGQDFSTRPRRRRVDAVGVVVVLLGLGLLAGVGWSWRFALVTKAAAAAELQRAQGEVRDLGRAVAQARVGGIGERSARAALVGRVPPRRFISEIASVLPDGVRLDSCTASYGAALEVQVAFAARDADAYDDFLRRLRGSRSIVVRGAGAERRLGAMKGTVVLGWLDGEAAR